MRKPLYSTASAGGPSAPPFPPPSPANAALIFANIETPFVQRGDHRISCGLQRVKAAGWSIEVEAAAPAVLPHALADGARDAWRRRRRRHEARRRARDLQHQLGAGGLPELLALLDRDHEGTGAADHAVLVVDVEILDVHGAGRGPLEHDRQTIDGDALGDDLVAQGGDAKASAPEIDVR